MASTEVEQKSQPLQSNKRCVLRVSIHCEGCKRKVKKLLQSLPGVDDIEIETKLQRVVVTGDVSPETLIRKLVKSGKPAQLWPENPPQIPDQKPPTTTLPEQSPLSNKEPTAKPEIPVPDSSKTPVSNGGVTLNGDGKVDEGVGKSEVTGGDGKASVELKAEEKKPETGSAGHQASQPVAEKMEEQTGQSGGGSDGKKKKKKKSQSVYKNVNDNGGGGGGPPATAIPSNEIPPRHHGYYEYPPPPQYYTPPPPQPPVYTVSYNTSHPPVNSYTASYYAAHSRNRIRTRTTGRRWNRNRNRIISRRILSRIASLRRRIRSRCLAMKIQTGVWLCDFSGRAYTTCMRVYE
ncbi:hypothetical protein OSB04_011708 [Centaurea solstitialis]|uniref:HMA domain-containing protein n=1 Tax=Centaurea solstitialis TaxID=347529 RepID=A0AA38TBP8_9ASTR|nr:hypothetical protein OSB04_011708 [Centaurea solstitialis]